MNMIDDFAKEYLHDDLRDLREVLVWKLNGLTEYDIRRPLTVTGTNLLGLVKHVAYSGARYFGEIFDRPFPDTVPRWNDPAAWTNEHRATQAETREQIIALAQRVWEHSDATIGELAIDAPGFVPWWPRPNVTLFNVMVHMLNETNRHAGHADILREQLDGSVGTDAGSPPLHGYDTAHWAAEYESIEQDAREADTPGM